MKYIINILAILILAAVILGIVNFKKSGNFQALKETFEEPVDFIRQGSKSIKHNIMFDFVDSKEKPMSMVREEAELMSIAPGLFKNFNRPDWDKFWSVIYQPTKEKRGSFGFKRYRTKDEIRKRFGELYGNAFLDFGSDDWKYFWDIVLDKDE